ncbi:hypothetical protein QJS10_CPA05g00572 [Acorus calamus]|uniref:Uncharacterized protein n=1 Tax=Acorus calamus TaxID=4465 RepID=A0AAV9EWJ9_ACOCL|nr:hypothetical protein QJS10_CPA05g00572 [Acorus calamus]
MASRAPGIGELRVARRHKVGTLGHRICGHGCDRLSSPILSRSDETDPDNSKRVQKFQTIFGRSKGEGASILHFRQDFLKEDVEETILS